MLVMGEYVMFDRSFGVRIGSNPTHNPTEYMDHGSLLNNETMLLDGEYIVPILRDTSHRDFGFSTPRHLRSSMVT